MARRPTKVGIIGAGKISGIYLENARSFEAFDITAVADVRVDGAQERANEYGVPKASNVEDLLADPDIELVINLTPHRAHGPVGLDVLKAGKHVYNEKPLAVDRADGQAMLTEAKRNGMRVGGAPDTFFGGAWQTARAIIDEGRIGEPVGAFANLHARRGASRNRPAPSQQPGQDSAYTSFYMTDYWEYGGAAIFDRGPYYLHALINLLGPVRRVSGSAQTTWSERSDRGSVQQVNVPTHVAGVLDFANGAACTMVMSDDVFATGLPHIEIYGSEGSLRCIDPNNFGGQLYLRKPDDPELEPVDNRFGYTDNSRGVGVADMAMAIQKDRPHRASGEMAYHVTDIINSIIEASREGRYVELGSTCVQPAALPQGLEDWTIDA